MAGHDLGQIHFLGQQDGSIEREFAAAVSRFFHNLSVPMSAYLCRVRYGDCDTTSVAVCMATPFEPRKVLVDGVSSIFRDMFGSHEHLDLIFIDQQQQNDLDAVCKPFHIHRQ